MALGELRVLGMEGLILDLRTNRGGPLRPALDTADSFLAPGVQLVELRSHRKSERVNSRHPAEFDGPLIILVGDETAGSAEALAWAIRSNRRAPLMGQTTAGQNLGYSALRLGRDVRAHLPMAEYRDAGGETWTAGLQPDYPLQANQRSDEPLATPGDEAIAQAAGWIRSQLFRR